jgi:hypothetical protein
MTVVTPSPPEQLVQLGFGPRWRRPDVPSIGTYRAAHNDTVPGHLAAAPRRFSPPLRRAARWWHEAPRCCDISNGDPLAISRSACERPARAGIRSGSLQPTASRAGLGTRDKARFPRGTALLDTSHGESRERYARSRHLRSAVARRRRPRREQAGDPVRTP